MRPFRVEVTGTWEDVRLRTEQSETQVYVVSANGPLAAEVAAIQLFGGEAARRRFRAGPMRTARVLDPDSDPV